MNTKLRRMLAPAVIIAGPAGLFAPTTHFVELGQAILFRGAGIDVVWKPFAWLLAIGGAFFAFSLQRFRKTIARMS